MLEARIRSLCDKHGVSLAAACRESGVTYGTLHAQLKNQREVPFSTIDRLARFFDVPIGFFSQFRPSMSVMSDQDQPVVHQRAAAAHSATLQSAHMDLIRAGGDLSTEQILDWLAAEGAVLNNFDAIRDRVDLFYPVSPTDTVMRPRHIGKQSLVSRQLGLESTEHYVDVISKFDRDLLDRVMAAHVQAAKVPYLVSDEAIETVYGDQVVRHAYRRVVARVRDQSGREFTLVHAKPI